jgi:HAD superfamily hydrolase (TIGR01549 family)
MIAALLFDLDDTLLGNSMETFLPPYFRLLGRRVGHLVPPERLVRQLMRSTAVMMANDDPEVTNAEAFAAHFFPAIGLPQEELMPLFEAFYREDFGQLRGYTRPIPEARQVIQAAFDAGFEVVIATQPVFPLNAIQQRMEWAGIADFPYAMVTSYENMHACKPNPRFFLEVCEQVGRAPGECLMIGDSLDQDIEPARRAGLKTFWVTEEPVPDPSSDWHGSLADLRRLIESEALSKHPVAR